MEISVGNKTAILFGATGMVGKFCLEYLLAHQAYEKVILFVRRKIKLDNEKLVQYVIDFEKLTQYMEHVKGDDLFITLGTTMAKAGSKEAFYRVDYKYVLLAAEMAHRNKVNQLLLVSSVGANVDSVFFYSRVKGEIEEKVKTMPFWSIHIFRPSVLLGERNENRFGEKAAGILGKGIDKLTGGMLTKYRPVEAETVAKAMVNAAQNLEQGIKIYPSHLLQRMSNEMK